MFDKLKAQVRNRFDELQKNELFVVDFDRDEIWNQFIGGFSDENRQEHVCNCCKSFLRQWGGVVAIVDGTVQTIWDGLDGGEVYGQSVRNLAQYVRSRPIVSTFLAEQKKCGTDRSLDVKRDVVWTHFYVVLNDRFVSRDVDAKNGLARTQKETLARGLAEITEDAVESVLELIAQNSLYRGAEFKGLLEAFLAVQRQYRAAPDKELFCWAESRRVGPALAKVRNSAVGTLLQDLSGGRELDQAVTAFERMVAPTNYKRPNSIVTPRMVADAKAKLTELGLLDCVERRPAMPTDFRTDDLLWVQKDSDTRDAFDVLAGDSLVNPRSLKKVEEIGIEDFIANVLPTTKSVEMLVENQHEGNFAALMTADDARSIFKWSNNFSWTYGGSVADSIREKVKAAGGSVEGELRVSLSWQNRDDLDLHVMEPQGNHIFFRSKVSPDSGGNLDVDMNAEFNIVANPVENTIFPSINRMRDGQYRVHVNNFRKRDSEGGGYELQIECRGEVYDFAFEKSPRDDQSDPEIAFYWTRENGISGLKAGNSKVSSREKWGVRTNTFTKVSSILNSPNHWNGATGNRHVFFALEGCCPDEKLRPFYNEFLSDDFLQHRKVLEILADKLKVEPVCGSVSGVGFSDTKRDSVLLRVKGRTVRTLRVNF